MIGDRGRRAGLNVGRGAKLERHPGVSDVRCQAAKRHLIIVTDLDVINDPYTVAKPIGTAPLQRLPDGWHAEPLTGVNGEMGILAAQVLEGIKVPGGREPGLGAGDVEADHARVAIPDDKLGDLSRPRGVAHRGEQAGHTNTTPSRLGQLFTLPKTFGDRLDHIVQLQTLREVLFWRVSHLGISHSVGGQVLGALGGDTHQVLAGLHDGDGVGEGLEVPLQRAGIRRFLKPRGQPVGVGCRKVVPDVGGQLDDRCRTQPAIKVVVQHHLGRSHDLGISQEGHNQHPTCVIEVGELGRGYARGVSDGALDSAPRYPDHWEADVVLSDGATAHIRPIVAADAQLLVDFYARVSDESKYFRFFAPYPRLSSRDVEYFTQVDHESRVAIVVVLGEEMIAVGRYERLERDEVAEVSFLVEDDHQGRGIGSVLLEHLAQAAREHGITRFVADVLPDNRKMITVFSDAGYTVDNQFDDGVVRVEFEIKPTDDSVAVTTAREHRAEARSIERLLTPRSVAVVGASRSKDKLGQALVRNLVLSGFRGPVYAVNPAATAIAGVPAFASVADIPGDVDLAVVAVPAETVTDVVRDCAAKGVRGMVVVSAGFAETGDDAGRQRQEEIVRLARANGIRVVGPNCLGVVNTDPAVSVNASLVGQLPPPGRVGFFAQSGALGTAILKDGAARGLGLSTFVSAGNRADVSGNDLLQYWRDDSATEVVLLYLETFGNPRKFFRLARRISENKPVLVVKGAHWADMPDETFDAMLRQVGVIHVGTISEMFDVAQVLAYQPLPTGSRVAVIANSDALCRLAAAGAGGVGLDVRGNRHDLGPGADASDYESVLNSVLRDDEVDALIVMYAPSVIASSGDDVAAVLAAAAARTDKPIVTSFLGNRGIPETMRTLDEHGVTARGSVPSYPTPEEAVRALGHVASYGAWRRRKHGTVPDVPGIDIDAARTAIASILRDHPRGAEVPAAGMHEILDAYGISLAPMVATPTLLAALEALVRFGGEGEVVLKATARHLRHRPDLADVWRNIGTESEMRDAWETMSKTLADSSDAAFVVQPMVPAGVPITVGATEDVAFGQVVSFGVSGVATELLGYRSYRIPPLTDVDAAQMVREIKAAPLLLGYAGSALADLAAVEDLLHRVGRLVDDLPEVASVELNPVLVGETGLSVVNASMRVTPPAPRTDWYARRL